MFSQVTHYRQTDTELFYQFLSGLYELGVPLDSMNAAGLYDSAFRKLLRML